MKIFVHPRVRLYVFPKYFKDLKKFYSARNRGKMPPKKKEEPKRTPLMGRIGTSLKCGIVGLPNVGLVLLYCVDCIHILFLETSRSCEVLGIYICKNCIQEIWFFVLYKARI